MRRKRGATRIRWWHKIQTDYVIGLPIIAVTILVISAMLIDALFYETYGSCSPCLIMEGVWDEDQNNIVNGSN